MASCIRCRRRINNNIKAHRGSPMVSVLIFLFRLIVGLIILFGAWFVYDNIHDRNTEIIVAVIGLQYAFIFMISRRLQYFGLTVFSFFGRTASYIQRVPYDQMLREEVGLRPEGRYSFLNVIFAALIEILSLFRLFSSLLGRGWDLLSEPIRTFLLSAHL
jgi:heme/copper-type cytochrome/quinol oxidase subunit 2